MCTPGRQGDIRYTWYTAALRHSYTVPGIQQSVQTAAEEAESSRCIYTVRSREPKTSTTAAAADAYTYSSSGSGKKVPHLQGLGVGLRDVGRVLGEQIWVDQLDQGHHPLPDSHPSGCCRLTSAMR